MKPEEPGANSPPSHPGTNTDTTPANHEEVAAELLMLEKLLTEVMHDPTAPLAQAQALLHRVQRRLKELEDDYTRLAYAYLRQKHCDFSEQDFHPEDYTVPAVEVLAELQQLVERQ